VKCCAVDKSQQAFHVAHGSEGGRTVAYRNRGLTKSANLVTMLPMPFVYPPESQIREALEATRTVAEAAQRLGFSVRSMHRYMAHYGIRIYGQERTEKRCTKCGLVLPLDSFYQSASHRYRGSCRDCYRTMARAHEAVAEAIKSGEMVAPDRCENCDRSLRLNAHHWDYSRPLDVEWLCRACHTARHQEIAAKAA
jgi:hypothetical protein